jgi:hypothetical protein
MTASLATMAALAGTGAWAVLVARWWARLSARETEREG